MELVQEEVFGPVLSVVTFKDEAEVMNFLFFFSWEPMGLRRGTRTVWMRKIQFSCVTMEPTFHNADVVSHRIIGDLLQIYMNLQINQLWFRTVFSFLIFFFTWIPFTYLCYQFFQLVFLFHHFFHGGIAQSHFYFILCYWPRQFLITC